MKYFFAYGIHLDDGKLTSICPNIKKIGKGILNNYELEFRVYLNTKKEAVNVNFNGKILEGFIYI